MAALISVIIPVYNVEAWLPACLDSVLSQTLRDIEVICIDDASPDGCGRILDEYAASDSRVQVIHLPENHMQGYGRNRGLEKATGEYVYFLDSDDMIQPDALEGMYRCMQTDVLDGLFFDSEVLFESKALETRHSGYPTGRIGTYDGNVKRGADLLDEFSANGDWLVYVQRQCWNRKFLLDHAVAFPERTEHEDELFSFLAVLPAERVRYVSERWFIRRYRADSVMTRPLSARDFHGYFTCFLRMTAAAERYGCTGEGAKAQILHMYEKADSLYTVFADEDPDVWFRDPVERRLFRFFRDERACRKELMQREAALWEPLKKYRRIYLYGAGRVASLALGRMQHAGLVPAGVLLSSVEGQPAKWQGLAVCQADQAVIDSKDAVVVTMSEAFRQELIPFLKQQGWNCWWYVKGHPEFMFVAGENDD